MNTVHYKNGNYNVILDTNSGTKIRYNNEDVLIPNRPESMDVTISKKCNHGCAFCYAECTPNGEHADILSYSFIDNLLPYTELALNGNEPLHPDIIPFLKKCRKLKLIPSLTVNQTTFMKNVDLLYSLSKEKLIYGLGVSLDVPTQDFLKQIKRFPNAVLHTIAGITTEDDYRALSGQQLKVLILGYKTVGRGQQWWYEASNNIFYNIENLKEIIDEMLNANWFSVLCFDNLAITQLSLKQKITPEEWSKFYMGDDGNFSMYIDMVDKYYAKNSMSDTHYSLTDNPIEMFNVIRQQN